MILNNQQYSSKPTKNTSTPQNLPKISLWARQHPDSRNYISQNFLCVIFYREKRYGA